MLQTLEPSVAGWAAALRVPIVNPAGPGMRTRRIAAKPALLGQLERSESRHSRMAFDLSRRRASITASPPLSAGRRRIRGA